VEAEGSSAVGLSEGTRQGRFAYHLVPPRGGNSRPLEGAVHENEGVVGRKRIRRRGAIAKKKVRAETGSADVFPDHIARKKKVFRSSGSQVHKSYFHFHSEIIPFMSLRFIF
jgi:hypothetical protein